MRWRPSAGAWAALMNWSDSLITVKAGATIGAARTFRKGTPVAALSTDGRKEKAEEAISPDDKDPMQVSQEEVRTRVNNMEGLDADQKKRLEAVLLKYRALPPRPVQGGAGQGRADEDRHHKRQANSRARAQEVAEGDRNREDRGGEDAEGGRHRGTRSPWSAPVLVVPKPDGGLRFCIDFRRLNRVAVKDPYPMPRIDEALDRLEKARWFTGCDAAAGYWQIPVEEESKEKTAFTIPGLGHMQFVGTPMGFTNSGAHFQRVMDLTLAGLTWEVCLVYLDDILIFSETFEELIAAMDDVFARLAGVGLVLKWKKCQFAQREIKFLGFLVGKGGVKINMASTATIRTHRHPRHRRRFADSWRRPATTGASSRTLAGTRNRCSGSSARESSGAGAEKSRPSTRGSRTSYARRRSSLTRT